MCQVCDAYDATPTARLYVLKYSSGVSSSKVVGHCNCFLRMIEAAVTWYGPRTSYYAPGPGAGTSACGQFSVTNTLNLSIIRAPLFRFLGWEWVDTPIIHRGGSSTAK